MKSSTQRLSFAVSPFSTNITEGHLEPQESQIVEVYFLPDMKVSSIHYLCTSDQSVIEKLRKYLFNFLPNTQILEKLLVKYLVICQKFLSICLHHKVLSCCYNYI